MSQGINLGRMFQVHAENLPNKTAMNDERRSFTYGQAQTRVERLGAALFALDLQKGDRVAVLMENCIEIIEVYLAAAQTGLVVVPINFMLVAKEAEYIINHSEAKAVIVEEEFVPVIEAARESLTGVAPSRFIAVSENPIDGYSYYRDMVETKRAPVVVEINGADPWFILYTSGTTGTPKGVIRSHDSYTSFYLINAAEFFFNEFDVLMNVMPLCHVNSTFYTLNVLYVGGTTYIFPARRFNALALLEVVDREKVTFISLVPTHYQLILEVPEDLRAGFDFSSLKKLLCSSAPARKETKFAIMELFPNVQLYEAYGSTEAGLVTLLRPHEQLKKLGSIGRECLGSDRIKILDVDGNSLPRGQVGEIYSRSPMLFDEYYKMPEKTKSSFRGGWFSAADMGMQDEDGYFYIVDRKDNMIITGGEKTFPKEIEEVIHQHPKVMDAAVIGTPHLKWGEVVTAVVVPKEGSDLTEEEIVQFCDGKMGKFKRPKKAILIADDEMPRTLTGKILHRELRKRYGSVS